MGKLSSATSNVASGTSDSTILDHPPQTITKLENLGAMAYNSAAIRIYSGEPYINYPWISVTAHEATFQSLFSTEVVLNMIKDGSYPVKFAEYFISQILAGKINAIENFAVPTIVNEGYLCRQIFQKELTSSDVGIMNRLLIPKINALKYFPHITENEEGDQNLLFYDTSMRPWRFRYVYWKSSQSYVFTKGWNTFVKANNLKAKDRVVFFSCDRGDGSGGARVIKVVHHDDPENRNNEVESHDDREGPERENDLMDNVESSS